jgi:hypothetical protein
MAWLSFPEAFGRVDSLHTWQQTAAPRATIQGAAVFLRQCHARASTMLSLACKSG